MDLSPKVKPIGIVETNHPSQSLPKSNHCQLANFTTSSPFSFCGIYWGFLNCNTICPKKINQYATFCGQTLGLTCHDMVPVTKITCSSLQALPTLMGALDNTCLALCCLIWCFSWGYQPIIWQLDISQW